MKKETCKKTCIFKKISQRIGKAWTVVICCVLALLLFVFVIPQLTATLIFHDFFKDAQKEFITPGLADGFVPQGFTYLPEQKDYLVCGYMADGKSASRIYSIPKNEPEKAYYMELVTEDGEPYTGHTGGIAVNGNFVFLANDGEGEDNCVWVSTVYELYRLEAGESLTLKLSFQPETRAAYCFVEDNYLWVGEFHRSVDYPTKESHAFTVAGGVEHRALVACYKLNEETELGIDSLTPTRFVSVPDHVQGFARDQYGHFILSTSYGLSKSHFLFYEDVTTQLPDASLTVNDIDVPIWYLDEDVLKRDLVCPPMSEEIVIDNNRIYYLTETASKKYIFGNFIRGRHVYSLPLVH